MDHLAIVIQQTLRGVLEAWHFSPKFLESFFEICQLTVAWEEEQMDNGFGWVFGRFLDVFRGFQLFGLGFWVDFLV